MEVRKWTTVDVYYNKDEEKLADKERKRLERLGYELQLLDDGSFPYNFCDQYMKSGETRIIEEQLTKQNESNH